jgi:hypothetical protein
MDLNNVSLICLSLAVELAMIMDRLYGGVCYAGIDTDPELKYPKVSEARFTTFNIMKTRERLSSFMYSFFNAIIIYRARVVWRFQISKATLQPFPLVLFSCNTMTLTNALK